ncbi:MAG: Uma2 family endonuclease [Aggregatilineales bacterium]
MTGADGGYVVGGERYIPDVAFISFTRQPEPSHAAYNPQPPDLAVEVLSPPDKAAVLRIKIVNYLRAGTAVWLVDPAQKTVEIYTPDAAPPDYR